MMGSNSVQVPHKGESMAHFVQRLTHLRLDNQGLTSLVRYLIKLAHIYSL
jgi:hypothetical protein